MIAPALDAAGAFLERELAGVSPAAAAAIVVPGRSGLVALGAAADGAPVTAATVFHVCSCSKTFTAAVFSRLVAEGAADWNTRMCGVVPEFELPDAVAREHCTFGDLAAMRTGLGRGGLAEWGLGQDLPTPERLARARFLAQAAPFRDRFSYSNLGYIALALAAGRIADRAYPALVDALILAPLGMADSFSAGFGVDVPAGAAAPAMPSARGFETVRDLTGPNSEGSARMHVSARDAAAWLRFLLDALAGSDAGPLPASAVRAMATPITPVRDPDARAAPERGAWAAYGLGLSMTPFGGGTLLRHGGGGRGWRHAMALAPEAGCGVMLMAAAETPAVEALALEALETLLGRPPRAWRRVFAAAADDAATAEQAAIEAAFTPSRAPPCAPPTGTYANPATGPVRVEAGRGGLRFLPRDAPDFTATLEPLGGPVHGLAFDEPALAPQPLDPPFRVRLAGSPVAPALDAGYFGRLELQP